MRISLKQKSGKYVLFAEKQGFTMVLKLRFGNQAEPLFVDFITFLL